MKPKKVCYTELAWLIGIAVLALGTALMERADFGLSMVVAPAYLLHLKLSQALPWFSFGAAEYALQALLLAGLALVMGRFKRGYLFSFATAAVYGLALDGAIRGVSLLPWAGIAGRAVCFFSGQLLGALGIAFLFHTYLAPEAYELVVRELSGKLGAPISRVKTIYDGCSCLTAILLSFAFFGFGRFEGVKLGTVFCALINGWLIGRFGALLERALDFRDGLKLRGLFEA